VFVCIFSHTGGIATGETLPFYLREVFSQKPGIDGEVFSSRKQQYGMNLQLICDHRKRIRFHIIGWPGSVYDSSVFDTSKIVENPNEYLSPGQYIIADSGYALKPYVCVPYRQPACELPPNLIYNSLFSSARVYIEHVNGMLKSRFASLNGIRTQIRTKKDFKLVNRHVLVCILLHNILQKFKDDWEYEEEDEEEDNNVEIPQAAAGGDELRATVQNSILRWYYMEL